MMRRRLLSGAALAVLSLVATGCSHSPPPPSLTGNLALAELEQAVRLRNPSIPTVVALANQYLASGRDADGHAYFCERSTQVPDRAAFRAFCGVFQVRMSSTVPLLQRKDWVKDGMAKLDQAAGADGLSRYLRGVVAAELPESFGRAQQATDDLQWVLAQQKAFPPGLRRATYFGLAHAYRTLGKAEESKQALAQAGAPSDSPPLVTDFSVNAQDGFRFSAPMLVEVAPSIYVARGYDFADIAFIVTSDQVVAIDAGTSEANARAALSAFRKVSDKPLRTVIVTHAHWDHIGGLKAYQGPDTQVIAQSRFAEELEIANRGEMPFRYFFGDNTPGRLELHPTRLIDRPESLTIGGTRFRLYPAHGGETADALLIELPDSGTVFVGDAFMPYFGAPFEAEGSVEGLLDTIALLRSIHPKLLIHGHTPLTENFTVKALEPLELGLRAIHRDTLSSIHDGVPLSEALWRNLVPAELEPYPDVVPVFLLMRENAIKRLYQQLSGYWKPDREGMEVFSPKEEAAALDLVADGDPERLARAAKSLNERGDFAMALRIAELGLTAHPSTSSLVAVRTRALEGLRTKYQLSPFKFIVYSEAAKAGLAPPP
ncbi:MAG TPA: MBL fold metallo-hydrolase [Myxococcaceae bacterium]|nr:MBL fold metallo-hydrolase [Myxococcaceae bacterium]